MDIKAIQRDNNQVFHLAEFSLSNGTLSNLHNKQMKLKCPHTSRYHLAEWYKKYFNVKSTSKKKKELYGIWFSIARRSDL